MRKSKKDLIFLSDGFLRFFIERVRKVFFLTFYLTRSIDIQNRSVIFKEKNEKLQASRATCSC
jgi:hypothetical protein